MTTKRIKTQTYSLPAYWASPLINNDWTGTDSDITEIQDWLQKNKPGNCIECSEDSYFGQFNGMGCDMLDYSFHKPAQVRTIDKIITKVSSKYGAPMGRSNKGVAPVNVKVYDCAVPMSDGAYDKGGAYWGIGAQLRVSYTKDLQYISFYRATR